MDGAAVLDDCGRLTVHAMIPGASIRRETINRLSLLLMRAGADALAYGEEMRCIR